jgi:hypothetical protein
MLAQTTPEAGRNTVATRVLFAAVALDAGGQGWIVLAPASMTHRALVVCQGRVRLMRRAKVGERRVAASARSPALVEALVRRDWRSP